MLLNNPPPLFQAYESSGRTLQLFNFLEAWLLCRFLVDSSINESTRLKNHVIGLVVVLLLAVDGQVGAQVAAQVGRGILEESPTIAETLQLITRTRLKSLFLTSKKGHSNTLVHFSC